MKKIILFLLICLLCSNHSMGQNEKSKKWYIKNYDKFKYNIPIDTLSFRVDYTNYCLYKYQKERMMGFGIDLAGITMIAFGNLDALNGTDKATETYRWEKATAGNSVEKQITAKRKYEGELNDIDKRRDILNISGGICLLSGSMLHLISYRWLKRAYVVPVNNGIGVGLNF